MVKDELDLPAINEYLKSVIDLIPAHYYFKQPGQDSEGSYKGQKKKRKNPEEDAAQKLEAKKKRYDESFMKTTSAQILDEIDDTSEMNGSVKNLSGKASSVTDLQKRLKDRIAEIRDQRCPKNKTPEEIEKVRARRKKERAKLKLKAKLKHDQNLKPGSAVAEMQGKAGQMHSKFSVDPKSPVGNGHGKAVFSKFDFGKEVESKKSGREKKHEKKKKLRTLLAQAESKKQKLEHLKETFPDEAETMVKKEHWGKALAKAEGVKVKDDPNLLRKSIKKEKTIKRQHAKKWKERDDQVAKKMQQAQEKRAKNIQIRKDKVRDKKIAKRAKKFAKSVPGF